MSEPASIPSVVERCAYFVWSGFDDRRNRGGLASIVIAIVPQSLDLASELERLVDLPTPIARERAAADLAKRCASRVDELLATARAFGRFEQLATGQTTERVALHVGADVEETELAWLVPEGYDPAEPAPLLLAFHGTGGGGSQMLPMWHKVASECGLVVLAPTEAGPNSGYRFSERERLAALAALRHARRRINVDENRVFATGISRGGHLAWDLALRFPDVFAGVAPMIGSPRLAIQRGENNLRDVENVAHLSIRDLQGAQDDLALVASVELVFERLKALGARDAQLFLQPEHGHGFDMAAVDWAALFADARREPRPERVVRASARKGEGRAFWIEVEAYSPSVDEVFTPVITGLRWESLTDDEQRRFLAREAEKRTSRLEAQRAATGPFNASSRGVDRWRLLLTADDFDPKRDVEISWNGDTLKKRVRPSAAVLLAEFAERFDRTFLPVAEIAVR
jgi:dienelactone hydrolase